jgi:hypothetical protein
VRVIIVGGGTGGLSVYSLSAFVPATEVHRESWTAAGDLADLHASLADACPGMHDLLALMNPDE